MRFLIVGLGSMGKRRIRNLKALGYDDIVGFDVRDDRCLDASGKYNIRTISSLDGFDFSGIDAMIVSVPPDMHVDYLKMALKNRKPVFVEAGVFSDGLKDIDSEAKKNNILICPSCTLRFHPAVKLIKLLVENGQYGKVTNWNYHCGQYLPDWHPWEDIKDFYVTRKDMGCREMVFFELTWLVDVFGYPSEVKGFSGETMNMGINDTFAFSMDFNQKSFGVLLVDVVSRLATRRLTLNLEGAQVLWNYHCGQYLPDWHPWEDIKDFYVTRKDMGCREMVFFELTWLVDVFGYPSEVKGFSGETMGMGINDTFAFSLDFNRKSFGVLLVDVVSRMATRRLTLNLEGAQVLWNWDEKRVIIFDADKKKIIPMLYRSGEACAGYNPSITEDMYIEEMKAFIDSINGEDVFPHCLQDDMKILKIMER